MKNRLILALVALLAFPLAALAQSTWATPQTASGGPTVPGGVGMCLNGTGLAVPCGASTPTYVYPGTGATWNIGTGGLGTPSTPLSVGGPTPGASQPPIIVAPSGPALPVSIPTSAVVIGGVTKYRVMTTASTNAAGVKAAPGNLYGAKLTNTSSGLRYVKFYDMATAPTVGTSTPILTVVLAANGGSFPPLEQPIPFFLGIAYAITEGVADSDTTATAANDVVGTLLYQ